MADTVYQIAFYLRISKEDFTEQEEILDTWNQTYCESNSIQNQRAYLDQYIHEHTEFQDSTVTEYCDDGYSGTDFERPGIQKLFIDVRNKKINCILVKDLSRFGRNYLEVGYYLEEYFPLLGIRFIGINDNYDSLKEREHNCEPRMEIAIKNLIYDYYSKDISQKVKAVLRLKQEEGKSLGGYVPYGYQRSKTEKEKYEIDPEAAKVVRKIFEWTVNGISRAEIARTLNGRNIPTPAERIMEISNRQGLWKPTSEKFYWTLETIIRILKNEVYLGNTYSRKYIVQKTGSRHTVANPKNDWYRKNGTHEPLISEELFQAAQRTFTKMNKPEKQQGKQQEKQQEKQTEKQPEKQSEKQPEKRYEKRYENLLAGLLTCKTCGYQMELIHGKSDYYICTSHRFRTNTVCKKDHGEVCQIVNLINQILVIYNQLYLSVKEQYKKVKEQNTIPIEVLIKSQKKKEAALKRLLIQEAREYEMYKILTLNQIKYQVSRKEYKENQFHMNQYDILEYQKEKLEYQKEKLTHQKENQESSDQISQNENEESHYLKSQNENLVNQEEYLMRLEKNHLKKRTLETELKDIKKRIEEQKKQNLDYDKNENNLSLTPQLIHTIIQRILFSDANHIEMIVRCKDNFY